MRQIWNLAQYFLNNVDEGNNCHYFYLFWRHQVYKEYCHLFLGRGNRKETPYFLLFNILGVWKRESSLMTRLLRPPVHCVSVSRCSFVPDASAILSSTKQQQGERRLIQEEGCTTTKILRSNHSYEQILGSTKSLRMIIVNDQYQLLYCYIPKVLLLKHRRWKSTPPYGFDSLINVMLKCALKSAVGYRNAYNAWFARKVFRESDLQRAESRSAIVSIQPKNVCSSIELGV